MPNRIKDILPETPSQNIIYGYTKEAKNEVQKIITKYDEKNILSIDKAPKREYVEGITIDASYSMDLDDGIWAYRKNDGGYRIEVSIADIAEIIPGYSHLDNQALIKTTSVYLNTHMVGMFPNEISTKLSSLNHDTKKLTLTIFIDLDDNGEVKYSEMKETIFHNRNRFDYEGFTEVFNNPDLEFHEELNLFYEISRKLRIKRSNSGARMDFDESNRKIQIGKKTSDNGGIHQRTIEEFMILANREAEKLSHDYEIDVVRRNHMPEYKNKKFLGTEFDKAFYSSKMSYHFGLALDNYMHFTSPIRRIADLMSHRQFKNYLRGEDTFYSDVEIDFEGEYISKKRDILKEQEIIENKKSYSIKKARLINKAEKGEISNFELSDLSIEDFQKVIYNSLGDNSFKGFSELIFNEIEKRIDNNYISEETLFLFILSGNKEIASLAFLKISKKYENFCSYIIKYLKYNSPIDKYKPFIKVFEKNKKIEGKYYRKGIIFLRNTELVENNGLFEENYIGKAEVRKSIITQLIDKKVNLSKYIVNSSKISLVDIIKGNYSSQSLSRLSMLNFEEIIVHFIKNNLEFSSLLNEEIIARINNGLILTDLSLNILLLSKREKFLKEIIPMLIKRKKLKFFIKYFNMKRNTNILENINENANYYDISLSINGKILIDLNSNDIIGDSYIDLMNEVRLMFLGEILEKEESFI